MGERIAKALYKRVDELSVKVVNDFLYGHATPNPWFYTAILGGAGNYTQGSLKHPGVEQFSSSPSANSGARFVLSPSTMILRGSEKTTIVFKTPPSQTSITRRMGFHTSVDSVPPTDGVFVSIADNILSASCKNNGSSTVSGSQYTLANDTWYRLVIEVADDVASAKFILYADDSDIVLWSSLISSNIPTARAVGHGDVMTSSGTSAITLGYLDYMDLIIPKTRKV